MPLQAPATIEQRKLPRTYRRVNRKIPHPPPPRILYSIVLPSPQMALARAIPGGFNERVLKTRLHQNRHRRRNRWPAAGNLPLHAARRTATDLVTLGNSGLQVTRLAFGTGSNNGHVQYALGQAQFTRLVRYAYDRGIRFFETAEAYMTPAMLGEALKGLPRDSYRLMTKVTTFKPGDPLQRFDEMRKTSQTEYFDIMLLHWQHTPNWVEETKRWQDGINEAQEKKVILKRGASVHGLPALRQMPGNPWLQIAMIRMNHKGTRMDGAVPDDGQSRQCARSGGAREAGEAAGHGRHQHEAGG